MFQDLYLEVKYTVGTSKVATVTDTKIRSGPWHDKQFQSYPKMTVIYQAY